MDSSQEPPKSMQNSSSTSGYNESSIQEAPLDLCIRSTSDAFMVGCSLLLLAAAHQDQASSPVPKIKEEVTDMDIKVEERPEEEFMDINIKSEKEDTKPEQAVSPSNSTVLLPDGNPALPKLELSEEVQQLILLAPKECPIPNPTDRLCPPRDFQLRSWGIPVHRLPGNGYGAFCIYKPSGDLKEKLPCNKANMSIVRGSYLTSPNEVINMARSL